MRIMLVVETLAIGGAETFVVRLANALAAESIEVVLAVTNGERVEQSLADRVAANVRLEKLNLPAKRLWWALGRALRLVKVDWSPVYFMQRRWLRRLVERYKPDALHSHLFPADRLVADVCGSQIPAPAHVITLHGDYAPFLKGHADPQLLQVERRMTDVVSSADAIVGVCQEHLDFLRAVFPQAREKLHLIYNGLNLPELGEGSTSRASASLPKGKFLFGMVSRGVEQKGWGEAIEAFEKLGREDACLVLVGDGPYIEKLRRRGVPSGVLLTGASDEPTAYIAQFDVCLLPTRFPHESLPTVVIEYLACAKPVIATEVGEIPMMLRPPDGMLAGRLLSFDGERIDVDQLCGFMAELMDRPDLRRVMGEAAAQAAKRFDMGECCQRYVRLYKQTTGSSGRGQTGSPNLRP